MVPGMRTEGQDDGSAAQKARGRAVSGGGVAMAQIRGRSGAVRRRRGRADAQRRAAAGSKGGELSGVCSLWRPVHDVRRLAGESRSEWRGNGRASGRKKGATG